MTRPPDGERIAAMEMDILHLTKQVDAMNLKLDGVVNTLSEISGGKKALMGLYGLVGTAIGAIATLVGLNLFGRT